MSCLKLEPAHLVREVSPDKNFDGKDYTPTLPIRRHPVAPPTKS